MNRVVAAMSGGVDSSVAAYLLKKQGYDVVGVTMQLWGPGIRVEHEGGCCSLSAVEDARRVANRLGIPYYVLNMHEEFKGHIIDYFADSYIRGMTPNPCIACNELIKFGLLLEKARQLGCDYVATGHYARVERDEQYGRYVVKKAVDSAKDQTYTFHGLTQDQLAHILTPLGTYTKAEVRSIAEREGFITARKPDSQEICFIPNRDYRSFLREYRPDSYRPGNIVTSSGEVLGTHDGVAFYTIGQRRGLGISTGESLYVIRLDPERNEVVVGTKNELLRQTILVRDVNWLAFANPPESIRVECKIRYRSGYHPALVISEGETTCVLFDEPVSSPTPGQSVAFYIGDTLVGGGKIGSVVS